MTTQQRDLAEILSAALGRFVGQEIDDTVKAACVRDIMRAVSEIEDEADRVDLARPVNP